ncbi:deubiquitinating enzyme [Ancistrocladus abbreviatus]
MGVELQGLKSECNMLEGVMYKWLAKMEKLPLRLVGYELLDYDVILNVLFFAASVGDGSDNPLFPKESYPLELDVYDFCSDDLQKKLEFLGRDDEGKKLGLKATGKEL